MGALWRRRVAIASALAIALAIFGGASVCCAVGEFQRRNDPPSYKTILVYYANETTAAAIQSENYGVLYEILRLSGSAAALEALEAIQYDAAEGPRIVGRDIVALEHWTRLHQIDFVAANNEAAMGGFFLWGEFSRDRQGSLQRHPMPPMAATGSIVIEYSPLSRATVLRSLLAEIATLYQTHKLRIILFVNTHGTADMALMPRVTTDFTKVNRDQVLAELSGTRNDLGLSAVTLEGTSKVLFWEALRGVGAETGATFPLVFLESCESGPLSWAEFLAIPSIVEYVAHGGTGSLSPLRIDYANLGNLAALTGHQMALTLRETFGRQGVFVDHRNLTWVWPALQSLAQIPSFIFFLPLAIWAAVHCTSAFIGRLSVRRLSKS